MSTQQEEEAEDRAEERKFWIMLSGTLLACIAIIAGIAVRLKTDPDNSMDGSGQFGDSFGWVNALAAMLGAILLIWTLRLQAKEFRLMRREYVATKKELEKSAEAQESLHIATLQGQYLTAASAQYERDMASRREVEAELAVLSEEARSNKLSRVDQVQKGNTQFRGSEAERIGAVNTMSAEVRDLRERILSRTAKRNALSNRIGNTRKQIDDLLNESLKAIQEYKKQKRRARRPGEG